MTSTHAANLRLLALKILRMAEDAGCEDPPRVVYMDRCRKVLRAISDRCAPDNSVCAIHTERVAYTAEQAVWSMSQVAIVQYRRLKTLRQDVARLAGQDRSAA